MVATPASAKVGHSPLRRDAKALKLLISHIASMNREEVRDGALDLRHDGEGEVGIGSVGQHNLEKGKGESHQPSGAGELVDRCGSWCGAHRITPFSWSVKVLALLMAVRRAASAPFTGTHFASGVPGGRMVAHPQYA